MIWFFFLGGGGGNLLIVCFARWLACTYCTPFMYVFVSIVEEVDLVQDMSGFFWTTRLSDLSANQL